MHLRGGGDRDNIAALTRLKRSKQGFKRSLVWEAEGQREDRIPSAQEDRDISSEDHWLKTKQNHFTPFSCCQHWLPL